MSVRERAAAVIGRGALGTFFAERLARAGLDTELVSRRAREAQTVKARVNAGRTMSQDVRLVPELGPGPFDLVVLATRADETLKAAWDAVVRLQPGGVLVSVQNGLTPLDVVDELGAARVVPGLVGFNAHLQDDTVKLTSRGGVIVGSLDAGTASASRAIVDAMKGAVPARVTKNPRGAVWSKWCISCGINGLAVVSGAGVGPLCEKREGREALLGVATECVALARAYDVKLERVAGPVSPERLAGSTRGSAGALRHRLVRAIGNRYKDVVPSSLEALRAGRDAELEVLNGRAVELGGRRDVPTPWNRAVFEVANEVVAGKRTPGDGGLVRVAQLAMSAGARS